MHSPFQKASDFFRSLLAILMCSLLNGMWFDLCKYGRKKEEGSQGGGVRGDDLGSSPPA